jgi:L-aminopeptidase/D-esterase-like protein
MLENQMGRRNWLRTAAGVAAADALGANVLGKPQDSITGREEPPGSIVDVGGIKVGQHTDARRPTGCTVMIFERGAVTGVDVRGSAPGTRETDLLNPVNTVERVNAILLAGGSAFGLDAASGVMRYLEENRLGYRVGTSIVPIVPAAILFDLNLGDGKIRPDEQAGYAACEAASTSAPKEGNVGAGAGATVGKLFGFANAMKSGLGSASVRIGDSGLVVAAIVAVNAVGDVRHRQSGRILAGARTADGQAFLDSMSQIMQGAMLGRRAAGGNTTIGVVATNANLTKSEASKVAQMAHDGLARTINPIHTAADGDTIFAAATGSASERADVTTIGAVGAEVMARAVNRAVLMAWSIPGLPAYRDLPWAHGEVKR